MYPFSPIKSGAADHTRPSEMTLFHELDLKLRTYIKRIGLPGPYPKVRFLHPTYFGVYVREVYGYKDLPKCGRVLRSHSPPHHLYLLNVLKNDILISFL